MILTDLDQFVSRTIIKLVLDIVANLTRAPGEGGTPIDTGWARANWVPKIGAPAGEVVGSRDAVSTGEQQAGVAEVATSYDIRKGPVHVTNNVPYIVFLNEGSSKQAPRAFVQRSMVKAVVEDSFK